MGYPVQELENEAAPLSPEIDNRVTLQLAPAEFWYSSDSPLFSDFVPVGAFVALRFA